MMMVKGGEVRIKIRLSYLEHPVSHPPYFEKEKFKP